MYWWKRHPRLLSLIHPTPEVLGCNSRPGISKGTGALQIVQITWNHQCLVPLEELFLLAKWEAPCPFPLSSFTSRHTWRFTHNKEKSSKVSIYWIYTSTERHSEGRSQVRNTTIAENWLAVQKPFTTHTHKKSHHSATVKGKQSKGVCATLHLSKGERMAFS